MERTELLRSFAVQEELHSGDELYDAPSDQPNRADVHAVISGVEPLRVNMAYSIENHDMNDRPNQ
jgi:hypothetical protein